VVPSSDYQQFQKQKITIPKQDQLLICYFEDGSFSTVEEKDTKPFQLDQEPYLTYVENPEFINDKGAILALDYLQNGEVPKHFDWLYKRKVFEIHQKRKLKSHSPEQREEPKKVEKEAVESSPSEPKQSETESEGSNQHVPDLIKETLPIPKKRRWIEMYQKSQKS
jgi:hypothetical protein